MPETETKPNVPVKTYNTSLPKLDLSASNLQIEWSSWLLQYKIFLRATNLESENDKRKVSLLLHHMGGEVLEIFKSFNLDLDNVTHEALVKKFGDYFSPKKNITMERNKFFNKKQNTDQGIMEFVTELKNLAKSCEFTETDSIIRDIFICNMRSEYNYIKEKLLEDGELTLQKSIEIAKSMEASRQRVSQLDSSEPQVLKVSSNPSQNFRRSRSKSNHRYQDKNHGNSDHRKSSQGSVCQKCGYNHRFKCPAYGKTCAKCGQRNHFAKMCKSPNNVNNIESEYSECGDSESNQYQDFFVGSVSSSIWEVPVEINGNVIQAQVDTGSQVNIISRYKYNILSLDLNLINSCHDVRLTSYSNDRIPILGKVTLVCKVLSCQEQPIDFFVTSVDQRTILGLNTCDKLGLIQRNFATFQSGNNGDGYNKLLSQYENLFEGIGLLPGTYSIPFDKTAPQHFDAPRKIPFKIKEKLKLELEKMVQGGIISRVTEPCKYTSSIVCVEKADKSLRICLDPRFINRYVTRMKMNNIPTLDCLVSEVSGSKIFSVLDCKSGFWSLKLDEESAKLTAFNTEFGIFMFNRLPFGITIASEVFQSALLKLFGDIPGLKIYIDDCLIYAKNKSEHDAILEKFLERASKVGLKLNRDKLQLGQPSVKFMGHIISSEGILPQESKVKAIENMQPPTNVKELQRFLGVVNYLGKFIKNLSQETVSLRSSLKKNVPWCWTPNHQAEFEKLKKLISSVPVLTYYDPKKPIILSVDSSCDSMGAVLLHEQNPIAYASKSLSDCQKRYSQIEKELLAILWGCIKFHNYIYGHSITVHTDHKPLISIFKKALSDVPCRLQRMMLRLQAYDLNVIHIPGKYMYIADTLSRANIKDNHLPEETDRILDSFNKELRVHTNFLVRSINVTDQKLEQIKSNTDNDHVLSKVKGYVLDGWPAQKNKVEDTVRKFYNFKDDLHVINDIVFKGRSLVIPTSLQKEMLERMHIGHLGISKTKQLVRGSIYWPGMNEDISNFIENCPVCLKYAKSNCKQPILPHNIPDLPWQKLGMDLFQFDSKNYLIIVDYYSQYFEICPVNSYNAQTVVTQCKSIFSRHGIPCQILSDGGPPFNSFHFKDFCKSWDIEHIFSSPYYPKSNGLVERTIGSVKNIFKKCKESNRDVYLGILNFRNTPKANDIRSPAMLLMSRQLRSNLPVSHSLLKPCPVNSREEKVKMYHKQSKMKHYHDRNARMLPKVGVGDKVMFKENPKANWVPATIVEEVIPCRSYKVKTPEGVVYQRNREHILKTPVSRFSRPETPHPQRSLRFDDNNVSEKMPPLRPRSILRKPSRFNDFVMEGSSKS